MRNRIGAALLCLASVAILYAAEHGGLSQAGTALRNDGALLMRRLGVRNILTATIAPDQTVQPLASELPAHDPTVGRLAGTAGTSGGAASYDIPIELPPGRNGMQPSFSLSYSSRSGNGIAGMGWSLSGLSSIHRCPATIEQDGRIGNVSLTNADKLCLDGQRLVSVSGTYGQTNATYDTEVDSFMRVTQLGGNLQSANTYFKVETKDGDILWFGNNSTSANDARIVPGGVSVPLTWMIERKEDRLGNFIHYVYSSQGNGESLLTDAFYTGFGAAEGDRSVHFTYQARPNGTNDNDRSSAYLAGGISMQTRRLSTISTWAGPSSNSNNEVRLYTLAYAATTSQSTHRSLLNSVTECAFLAGQKTCRPPTAFTWQQGPMQNAFHLATLADGHLLQRMIGDLDGDGSPEALIANSDGTTYGIVSLNADRSVKNLFPLPAGLSSYDALQLDQSGKNTDFDGDGRDDLIGFDANNHFVIYFWDGPRSAGTFDQAFTRKWDTGIQALPGNYGSPGDVTVDHVGDMDGDGRPDIVLNRFNNTATQDSCATQIEIYRNVANAAGPDRPSSFSLISKMCLVSKWVNPVNPEAGTVLERVESVQDINGDGLSDILLSYPGNQIDHPNGDILYGQRSSGYGLIRKTFLSLFPATSPATKNEQNGGEYSTWIDVNGDGLRDYIHLSANSSSQGTFSLRLNTGSGLGALISLSYSNRVLQCNAPVNTNCGTTWTSDYAARFVTADIDNDGREELLIPQHIAAAICGHYTYKVGGEWYGTYECPPDPVTGQLPAYSNLLDPVSDLYLKGDSGGDASAYGMDALRFIQTGPTSFRVVQEQTTQINGGQQADVYGDGLNDGLTYYRGSTTLNYKVAFAPSLPGTFPDGTSIGVGGSYLNEGRGPSGQLNPDNATPELPDLMSMVTDGMGGQTVWTYYPLSSAAGRNPATDTPLYTIPTDPALKYADNANVYFSSSMPVVSDMSTSDGIGGFHTMRYGYDEAMYNERGRGFQGFRKIIEEDLTAGLRTTTTYNQRFPLAGKIADVVVNSLARSGTDGAIKHETYAWRCNLADRSDAGACTPQNGNAVVKFPFLDEKDTRSYDATVALQDSGTPRQIGLVQDINADDPDCAGSIATASGFDAHGNLLAHTVISSDKGPGSSGFRSFVTQRCINTSATYYAANLSAWWLDKLKSTTTTTAISYDATNHPLPTGVGNPLHTVKVSYTWNDDRTPASQTVQAGVTGQQKVTSYGYPTSSNYGLPNAVAVVADGDLDSGGAQRTRTSTIGYSADGYFPASTTNALGQTSRVTTSPRDGRPTLAVDANDLRTLMSYDAFGQLTKTQFHGTSDSVQREPDQQTALTWCRGCAGLTSAVFKSTTVQDGSPTTITTHDLFGRVIQAGVREQDGSLPLVQTVYDALGRVQEQSTPYVSASGRFWTTYLYDALGRVTQKVMPKTANDGRGDMVTTYTYSGLQTAIQVCGTTDPDASKCLNMTRTTDSLGRYMETVDALNGVTQYWYDGEGHTLAVVDANGSLTKAAYNAIGQRTNVNDPNQGLWKFGYDALGEVLAQTDARNVVTSTTYDVLGRPLTRSASIDETGDGVADAVLDSWTYDPFNAKGEAATSQRTVNSAIERKQVYSYDTLSRLMQTETHQQISAGSYKDYTETVAFDGYYGRPKSIGYPNGEAVATYYSPYGHPIASFNPVDNTVYRQVTDVDARGNPTTAILGGASLSDATGLMQDTRTYRARTGELLSVAYASGGTQLRNLSYQSDVFGNLTKQNLNVGQTVESFVYDPLMRMSSTTRTGAAHGSVAYGYDAAGNFTSKSDFSTTAANAYNYTGGTCGGGPNAVKSVAIATGGARNYCYDADGNLTSDSAGLAVTYDHDNLPVVTARGGSTIWLAYGPDNQHTREWGSGDGTKVYLDGGYEDWVTQGTTKVYVGTEAEITSGPAGRNVNYLLTDRLGSVDSIADNTGTLVEMRGSDAFGKPRSGTWADLSPAQIQSTAITARGFTEHEHLNAVQLIHMNGRVYDYQLGRFLSVDPLIQVPLNSQSLNPYSYILNNPLAGTDPTGYECDTLPGGSVRCHPDGARDGPMVGTHILGNTTIGMESSAHFHTASNGAQRTTSEQNSAEHAKPSALPASCGDNPDCAMKFQNNGESSAASGAGVADTTSSTGHDTPATTYALGSGPPSSQLQEGPLEYQFEMTASPKEIDFIKGWEGWNGIFDKKLGKWLAKDDGYGNGTIGWGHNCGKCEAFKGGITSQEGDALLMTDAAGFEKSINSLRTPMHPREFDGLLDFAFNVRNYSKSTLFKNVASGMPVTEENFTAYGNARVKQKLIEVPSLVLRRRREYETYANGTYDSSH